MNNRITYDENGTPRVNGIMPQWKIARHFIDQRGVHMCELEAVNDAAKVLLSAGIVQQMQQMN